MHRLRYVFVAGLLALPAYAGAQVKDATDVLASEIEALAANLAKGGDMQGRLVDFGKINVGIGVVRWPAGARGVLAHSQVGEVYYMVEGTGTLVTGGTMPGAKPMAATGDVVKILVGPSTSSEKVEAGTSRKIGPGDVIIIPPGVPHQWLTVDTPMKYVVVRIDPDKVLPAGYVNPALKK